MLWLIKSPREAEALTVVMVVSFTVFSRTEEYSHSSQYSNNFSPSFSATSTYCAALFTQQYRAFVSGGNGKPSYSISLQSPKKGGMSEISAGAEFHTHQPPKLVESTADDVNQSPLVSISCQMCAEFLKMNLILMGSNEAMHLLARYQQYIGGAHECCDYCLYAAVLLAAVLLGGINIGEPPINLNERQKVEFHH